MILVKQLKNLTEYWDEDNKEFIFERDKVQFVLKKGELFPTQRAFTRVEQKGFYKNVKKSK
jgi:hypothetical protein